MQTESQTEQLAHAFSTKMNFNASTKMSGNNNPESEPEAKGNNREFGRELTNGGSQLTCVSLQSSA